MRPVGRRDFRRFAAETFSHFPGAAFEVRALFAAPFGVVARYEGGWAAPDGARVNLPGAVLFRFGGELSGEIGVRLELRELAARLSGPPQVS